MTASRCPSCGAAVRPDAPWCLLCHRDLRPAARPVAVAATADTAEPALTGTAEPGPALVDTAQPGSAQRRPAPAWPCVLCGADNGIDATVCTACGAAFLAALRQDSAPALRLPVVGDVFGLSKSARAVLAVGVGLLVALLLIVLVAVLGKVV